MKKKLTSWFEISEKEYIWYILQGYEIIASENQIEWYLDGNRHRTDGPACERADGSRGWYINGKLHRTDGPAVEWASGSREWYINDRLHRTDGPAIEYADGTRAWWVNGKKMTEKEFNYETSQLV